MYIANFVFRVIMIIFLALILGVSSCQIGLMFPIITQAKCKINCSKKRFMYDLKQRGSIFGFINTFVLFFPQFSDILAGSNESCALRTPQYYIPLESIEALVATIESSCHLHLHLQHITLSNF